MVGSCFPHHLQSPSSALEPLHIPTRSYLVKLGELPSPAQQSGCNLAGQHEPEGMNVFVPERLRALGTPYDSCYSCQARLHNQSTRSRLTEKLATVDGYGGCISRRAVWARGDPRGSPRPKTIVNLSFHSSVPCARCLPRGAGVSAGLFNICWDGPMSMQSYGLNATRNEDGSSPSPLRAGVGRMSYC